MATINQIVRNGRGKKYRKGKAPALNHGFDSLKRKQTDQKTDLPRRDLHGADSGGDGCDYRLPPE